MTLMQLEIDKHFEELSTVFLNTYEGEIPKEVLKIYSAPKRARLHYTSRLALLQSLKINHVDLFKSYTDLEITNHQFMKKSSSTKVSISHTNSYAMACSTTNPKIESIGVDLESCNRELKEGIKKFYIIEADEISDPLHLWCIKEAAFKAVSPLFKIEKQLVLKDITVHRNGAFSLEIAPDLNGFWKLVSEEEKIFTHAIILKK
jgi:phosphopantetheinyl transferase (holo-ACP synthase)